MFFTLFFTLFFMYEFEYDLFNQKKPQFIISCLNSLKTMNSGARRKVLAKTSDLILDFVYEFMGNV